MGNYVLKTTQHGAITDDSGSGTDGTIFDAQWFADFVGNDLEAGLYADAADANAFIDFNSSRGAVVFGPGGGSALDTYLEREASTVLAIRNAADSGYGILRGADPSGANDYATKNYVDTFAPSSFNVTGDAPSTPAADTLYADSIIKAWANVTFSGGTPSIADDVNVASLTDNAQGDTTVNFATAMANATYATCANVVITGSSQPMAIVDSQATGSVRIITEDSTGADQDYDFNVIVVGSN